MKMKVSLAAVNRRDEPATAGNAPRDTDADLKLGMRIRALRSEKSLTLAALAGRTQISIGQLSEIERGISAPSLRSLRLISEALGIAVGRMFDELPPADFDERYVLRKGERPVLRLTPTGVTKALVSPRGAGTLTMYEIMIFPNGTSGGEFQTGPGEKAGIVVTGRMRLWIDHKAVDLAPGDSFQFPAELPHSLENPFDVPATLIWIVGPQPVTTAPAAAKPPRKPRA